MRRFSRAEPPSFWEARRLNWLRRAAVGRGDIARALRWREAGRSLGEHFHSTVRADDALRACAYCDQVLLTTSFENIDHVCPVERCPGLGLDWWNLLPACNMCNGSKGSHWDDLEFLVRPDVDPVEEWVGLEFDAPNQRIHLVPARSMTDDDPNRKRVETTIKVLRLNAPERSRARFQTYERTRRGDAAEIDDILREGPFRFLVARVRIALGD